MVCIYCDTQLDVVNSRHQKRNNQVWRRRLCSNCGAKFTTLEKLDLSKSLAVKDIAGKLSPFDRDKLLISIYKSAGHRKNAITDASELTDTITKQLIETARDGLIHSRQIIDATASVLQNFDNAAVVQYEAYHTKN